MSPLSSPTYFCCSFVLYPCLPLKGSHCGNLCIYPFLLFFIICVFFPLSVFFAFFFLNYYAGFTFFIGKTYLTIVLKLNENMYITNRA